MTQDRLYEESAISTRSNKERKFYMAFFVLSIIFFVIFAFFLFFAFPTISRYFNDYHNADANVEAGIPGLTKQGLINYIIFYVMYALTPLAIAFAFWKIKNRFNVSYDYTFVQDELRITKVFNGRRRKFITTIRADQIMKIGWCDKPSYEDCLRGLNGKTPKRMTPNKEPSEEKEFIYISVSTSLERRLYVLECRRELLERLVFVAGRNKLERE